MKRIVLILLFTLFSGNLIAEELSRFVVERVQQAYQLQNGGENSKAIAMLERVESNREFDTAYVQRMLGILYWQEQQMIQAEKALFLSIKVQALPAKQQLETERMYADVLLFNGKVEQALHHYHEVVTQNKPLNVLDAKTLQQVWLRIAQANYQLEQWQDVLNAVDGYLLAKGVTTVSMLTLRLGAELSLKQWNKALKSSLALRGLEPKKESWWIQTVNLYLQVENYVQALASLKQYQRAGFLLSENQLRMMAQLYAKQAAFEKSAQIFYQLNKENAKAEDLAIEAQYWQQAREWANALEAWRRAANKDISYRWSYIDLLMQDKQYKIAFTELEKVEPSFRRELAFAQVYYHIGDRKSALKYAKKALKIKSNQALISWVNYLTLAQDN